MERERTHKYFSGFRAITRIILSLFAVVLLFSFLCSRKPQVNTEQQSPYTQREKGSVVKVVDTPELVRYKVKAVWDDSVIIRCRSNNSYWKRYYDPDYRSVGNDDRLYKMVANESSDPIMTKKEGMQQNGRKVIAEWGDIIVRNLQFSSMCMQSDGHGNLVLDEKNRPIYLPVYLIVEIHR